ncbi:aminotransferase class III-fold pyridoxal phosphate-dependent enzyme [Burkholderia multivorans]|uniref:aminotransferase class III-fold pyridoxal phosphate-dependent enzyme n=1 Tax=Burkholderia multivorans TaxID=87883 RepID=UPI001C215B45|nr:aminotransferase class III-fold pyridoxal phosphate-dependent enzyme [Burkholderia multivorans]MBU9185750.1 aminotransferase class III-fold pyridoxal phosphate-dependent enzyme [Burkholderia multivorans]MBU9284115.1 aminotransferase class III-fold pyridoxal phosphate-dependent enzyme [Burkholderia multivorans]MDN7451286.1 aminotransferase class III-fold pyridoxal phosphate-dependent enzyme [Burkholderia multivorans]
MNANVTAADDAFFMPFTSNRRFRKDPVLFHKAKGMHYYRADGSAVLDGIAGLWCVNAGHGQERITQAICDSANTLDFASNFQMSHPTAGEYARALVSITPPGIDHVFFSNSGSEAVDTALKIALAYQRAIGQPQRVRLIGRERGYHGVGFGGLSVAGIASQRKPFGNLLPFVDHLPHTYNRAEMAFTDGQPKWGAHLADDLSRIIALHDASTIAAVIVEPVAGSTGVIVPPIGYLQRLRDICTQHGILLIFDEVISGFGRLGAPFAATRFGVTPDIITSAKGLTNGAVPMGATFVSKQVFEGLMTGPIDAIEFPHGYTYSGHPLACAAGLAALEVYQSEGLLTRAAELEAYWAAAAHKLRELPGVLDIRNIGLLAAIDLTPDSSAAGKRAYAVHRACLRRNVLIRASGDTMLLSPPLVVSHAEIDEMFDALASSIRECMAS